MMSIKDANRRKVMKNLLASAGLAVAFSTAVLAHEVEMNDHDRDELQVVDFVDTERYLGTWYEVAAIPQWFQRDCIKSRAEYSLLDSGDIKVVNLCSTKDNEKRIEGKAWITDNVTNAKLKVQFFWPFSGNYWIIELDSEYQFAVVGEPDRDALWILSRTPQPDQEILEELLYRVEFIHGYDRDRIKISSW